MKMILENEERQLGYRRAGIERAAEFSWQRTAGEATKVYTVILEACNV